ncbi:hypothetical protein PG999_002986 [Apiospora kogelbergensis]|uniref:Peptidase A1 domain-containing protein n=1 Tax=Apiospora kogelbergensis TaxID=1337665 RepID=A0AAW0RA29_9PEZI
MHRLVRNTVRRASRYFATVPENSDLGWYYIEQNLVDFSGPAALDTFQIGGGTLRVPGQPFVAVEHAQPMSLIHLWLNYDGVLGVSPRCEMPAVPTASRLPSLWSRMVQTGVLDDNIFDIEVPHAMRGSFQDPEVGPTTGEMTFGGVSAKYRDAKFAALPLMRDDDRVWAVETQSVRWENKTEPINYRFNSSTIAVFSTGRSFTVTAFQYAYQVVSPEEGDQCTFNIFPTSRFAKKGGPIPKDALILGSPFLNAYYSVYDLDNMEIRLTEVNDGAIGLANGDL